MFERIARKTVTFAAAAVIASCLAAVMPYAQHTGTGDAQAPSENTVAVSEDAASTSENRCGYIPEPETTTIILEILPETRGVEEQDLPDDATNMAKEPDSVPEKPAVSDSDEKTPDLPDGNTVSENEESTQSGNSVVLIEGDEEDEEDEEDEDKDDEKPLSPLEDEALGKENTKCIKLFRKGKATLVAKNGATRYVSTDRRVAIVSKKGVVRARQAGECQIECYRADPDYDPGTDDKEDRWELVDSVSVMVYSISAVKSVTAEAGDSFDASEWLMGENQAGELVTDQEEMTRPISWISTSDEIASVSRNGIVSLLKAGSARIFPEYGIGRSDAGIKITVKKESKNGSEPIIKF